MKINVYIANTQYCHFFLYYRSGTIHASSVLDLEFNLAFVDESSQEHQTIMADILSSVSAKYVFYCFVRKIIWYWQTVTSIRILKSITTMIFIGFLQSWYIWWSVVWCKWSDTTRFFIDGPTWPYSWTVHYGSNRMVLQ